MLHEFELRVSAISCFNTSHENGSSCISSLPHYSAEAIPTLDYAYHVPMYNIMPDLRILEIMLLHLPGILGEDVANLVFGHVSVASRTLQE